MNVPISSCLKLLDELEDKGSKGRLSFKRVTQTTGYYNLLDNMIMFNFTIVRSSNVKNFNYPPFYKLIAITLKHENIHSLDASAQDLADLLKVVFKERVIGPEYPIVQKIRNKYLKTIKIKIEKEAPDLKVKQKIKEIMDTFYSGSAHKKTRVVIDVDPI
jgi:primosomal protein N' (replication factor Y)